MKRINPFFVLIGLNIAFFAGRELFLSEEASMALAASVEAVVQSLGLAGYLGIVLAYVVCAFFFIPLLIPLNMLGGAIYGAYIGTIVALIGVTLGTAASVYSARHVFKAVPDVMRERRWLKRLLDRADRHRNLAVVLMRFSVVIPYLYQNIALAATRTSTLRITLLTLVSAIPGAAIYSFLGAGLVRADQATDLVLYIALPVLLMIGISIGLAWVRKRYEA